MAKKKFNSLERVGMATLIVTSLFLGLTLFGVFEWKAIAHTFPFSVFGSFIVLELIDKLGL